MPQASLAPSVAMKSSLKASRFVAPPEMPHDRAHGRATDAPRREARWSGSGSYFESLVSAGPSGRSPRTSLISGRPYFAGATIPGVAPRDSYSSERPAHARVNLAAPEPDSWDLLRRKSFLGENGGAPLIGPNSNRRRSSKRQSMMKRNILVMEETFAPEYKRRILALLEGARGVIFMTLVTLWSLFGDDVRLAAFEEKDDPAFVGLTFTCLALFSLEMALLCVAKKGYPMSFYFWLDAIATLSLLLDVPDFMTLAGLRGDCDHDAYGHDFDAVDVSGGTSAGGDDGSEIDGTFARAARAARAGTRAGRIVRAIRLVRVAKLYSTWRLGREGELGADDAKKLDPTLNDDEVDFTAEETRVGQRLSDLTTRRVIVGVLGMLFVLPFFNVDTYDVGDDALLRDGGLRMLHDVLVMSPSPPGRGFYDAVDHFHASTPGLYALVLNGTRFDDHAATAFSLDGSRHAKLRCEEFRFAAYVSPPEANVHDRLSFAFFDVRDASRAQAALNMCRTVFVCVVLGVGALMFSRDANFLVLKPIERMVKKVRDVSENPLTRFEVNDDADPAGEQMETRLLENSIAKICGLLAVGFGEAGSEIIAENMKRGGEIDPMIPGKKIVAIFGFCDIRQFTDTTEVLQEGVMEFVNTIGKIVHMEVHLHGGSANKNIGDAFLLVWKFPKDVTLEDVEHPEKTAPETRSTIAMIADNALASFIVIMAGLRRSAKLNTYRNNVALAERIPDFEVKMGFGLHVGWAIEGAIGSEYKVDASYLSPNVNLSARLEAATKQFGVPLLLSENFVNICGASVASQCRQIDRVTVKGSVVPMGLYTYDTNVDEVPEPTPDTDPTTPAEAESNSFAEYDDEFSEHPDIVALRKGITREFLEAFRRGFELYRDGDWAAAAEALRGVAEGDVRQNARGRSMVDGPSRALIEYMRARDFKAPRGWAGCRELTEK